MDGIFIADIARNFIVDFLRTIGISIDFIVYSATSLFFRVIFDLANFELVGFYEAFEKRVYVVLGIFMLFKITISFITYLVNPDKINDKEQGMGKIVTRVITVLVMLIALPTFFGLMSECQNKLLPVIPRVVIGTTNTFNGDDVNGVVENMSVTMLQGFAHAKTECDINQNDIQGLSDIVTHINDPCSDTEKTKYKYDYLPIVSTLTGVLMCYVLFSLCISVAIRAFKLIILRTIAPVPVISYIDPKSAKNGAFSTWLKTLFTVWGELFLHLAMIYFVVFFIDFLLSADAWEGFFGSIANKGPFGVLEGTLFFAFLVVGLLFFAKQAPKFLMDALGIKSKGSSFTKMLGMGATALGAVGSAKGAYKTRNQYDADNNLGSHRLRNLGASLFNGMSSASNGGSAILSTDKPTLRTGIDAEDKYNNQNLGRIRSGSTLMGRNNSRLEALLGGETEYDRMTRIKVDNEEANKKLLQFKNTLEKKALEKKDIFIDLDNQHRGINYLELQANLEGAGNGDATSLKWFVDHGWGKTEKVKVGVERVFDAATNEYHDVEKYEDKVVADWQSAQVRVDDVKDAQTQAHAVRVIKAVADGTAADKYGTEYNDYRLAKHATEQINMEVDFTTYANGNKTGIKQSLGKTNQAVTDVVTDPKYEAAAVDKKESKK